MRRYESFKAAAAHVEQPTGDSNVSHESPYLTAVEAAAYLRYANVRALYKAVAELNIPCRRRGGKTFLFHRGELEAWLKGETRLRRTA